MRLDVPMKSSFAVLLVVGVFLILLLPRFLPFSADSRVASLVMGQDRISAAYAMINSVDPLGVKMLQWGAGFYDASGGEISACLEKAKQAGKDQVFSHGMIPVWEIRGEHGPAPVGQSPRT